jgi:hypothetical protein
MNALSAELRATADEIWEAQHRHSAPRVLRRARHPRGAARARGEPRERMREVFVTSSRYELSFWEMAWTLEGWPELSG